MDKSQVSFANRLKKKFSSNEPIFTNEILELFAEYTRAYVFRLINKSKSVGELVQFSSGVYYIPQKADLGLLTITSDDVMNKKYVQNGNNVYGIYSGVKLQNEFSVTSQMPDVVEIVTSNGEMKCRKIEIGGRKFVLRKARCQISKANVNAYKILQLFVDMGTQTKLNDLVKERIIEFIVKNKISTKELMDLAKVFPIKVKNHLISSGVLDVNK